jgi:four helix bundle protein
VTATGFRDLEVYQRSAALADALHGAVRSWDWMDKKVAGVQLMRAADSVGANIAEAVGRWSHADQVRFLFIARGSALEVDHWIMRAQARDLPCPPGALDEARRVGRMLNGLISALRSGRIKSL